jgi:hypothetical protein
LESRPTCAAPHLPGRQTSQPIVIMSKCSSSVRECDFFCARHVEVQSCTRRLSAGTRETQSQANPTRCPQPAALVRSRRALSVSVAEVSIHT